MKRIFRLLVTTLMLLTVAPLPGSAETPAKIKTSDAETASQIPWLVNCASVS